ncbi:uncharacterized protein LOC105832432 isoform X2 [Monomorium pharaonis]|uniref:uncharacterized protein LOC105832432 isoform X2 n=1 Tax=Monomorium pharaonis TaxID=307658 RepID=UPI0017465826|nr:uncharacterized protein LOC105832432 isoform X2 [Monomorium pharaonis]
MKASCPSPLRDSQPAPSRPSDISGDLTSDGRASSKLPPVKAVQLLLDPAVSTQVEKDTQRFANKLFGPELAESNTVPWNELISRKWLEVTRKVLSPDSRDLLKRYIPSDPLEFLRALKLNSEIKSALRSNAIIKRDEHYAKDQGQARIAVRPWRSLIRFSETTGTTIS